MTLQHIHVLCSNVKLQQAVGSAYVFTGNLWLDWIWRTIIISTDVITLKPPETDGGEYRTAVSWHV